MTTWSNINFDIHFIIYNYNILFNHFRVTNSFICMCGHAYTHIAIDVTTMYQYPEFK